MAQPMDAVKNLARKYAAGNKQTEGIGPELRERARMQREAETALGPTEHMTPASEVRAPVVDTGARYGDRGDEKRMDVSDWVKPLGAKVYDKGGKVKGSKKSKVNVKDGKHQMAILKEGERVLTPEQNKRYEKSEQFDKENPAENAMEMKIYDKGGKVNPFGMITGEKKSPKTIQKHEYHRTHNGKHVVTHKHHGSDHKDEQHMFEKFSDAADHMEQNPPQPEQAEAAPAAPAAGAPAAGGPPMAGM